MLGFQIHLCGILKSICIVKFSLRGGKLNAFIYSALSSMCQLPQPLAQLLEEIRVSFKHSLQFCFYIPRPQDHLSAFLWRELPKDTAMSSYRVPNMLIKRLLYL